jgi:RNA polymerase-binding protein DksA
MNKAELEKFREQLWAVRNRLAGVVDQLADESFHKTGGAAAGNLSNTPMHLADLGSDQEEEERTLGLLENEERLLEEVTEAINRIHRSTFGKCEECGQDIGRERLQAIPYTRHCIGCARKLQEEEQA